MHALADADCDGFLNFHETAMISRLTSGQELDEEVFTQVRHAVGASEMGLSRDTFASMYEMGMGVVDDDYAMLEECFGDQWEEIRCKYLGLLSAEDCAQVTAT